MKLQNDGEEEYGKIGLRMPSIILLASAAIFAVLAIVLLTNGAGKTSRNDYMKKDNQNEEQTQEQTEERKIVASDLNFWNMYRDNNNNQSSADHISELEQREAELNGAEGEIEEEEELDPSKDGKHTMVVHMDGSTEWLDINSSLKLNNYDDLGFQSKNGIVGYYVNGSKTTKTGADISQYTTVEDWNRLASEVDYLMIRVGARGYDTGQIIADTKFLDNITGAIKYNIPYGVYFSTQAITEDEARDEAKYVMTQLANAQASAKAAIASGSVENKSTSAIDNQTQSNSTNSSQSNVSTPTNFVMGFPAMTGALSSSASDNDGNTTYIYSDGIAVTKYASGDVVTAYGNGSTITNFADGSITKKDNAGNLIEIDTKGNYTVKNSAGNVTSSGTTTQTTGLTISSVGTAGVGTVPTNNTNNNSTTIDANGIIQNSANSGRMVYPIAVDMHVIANDTSRIQTLSNKERTAILSAFCNTVETSGYESAITASKEFLICQMNIGGIENTDIWLNNVGELPDYPYLFDMWKYSSDSNLLKSLSGQYGVDVSFIDYSMR